MVAAGQVAVHHEAMKLMNEIESDMAGEIHKKTGKQRQPVEYGQPFLPSAKQQIDAFLSRLSSRSQV